MKYYINGWQYGARYFWSVRRFTSEERDRLERGEMVEKDGNTFWIITE